MTEMVDLTDMIQRGALVNEMVDLTVVMQYRGG